MEFPKHTLEALFAEEVKAAEKGEAGCAPQNFMLAPQAPPDLPPQPLLKLTPLPVLEPAPQPEVIAERFEICAEAEPATPETAAMPIAGQVQMKGGWAETVFQARAIALGFVPFRPVVPCTALDTILEWDGRLLRIQVKSAWELAGSGYCYQFPIVRNKWRDGKRKPYGKAIDFFAAFVPTLNAWYIIPAKKINWKYQSFGIYPREWWGELDALGRKRRERKAFDYEVYRERWDLLTKAVR